MGGAHGFCGQQSSVDQKEFVHINKMADLRANLHHLELKGVEETGDVIGKGAYGEVQKVKYKGMLCAGKKLHNALAEAESEQSMAICERFEQECIQLSKLRHPNITAFLGVYFQPNSTIPLLIMEFVPISLDECLTQYPDLPDYVKNKILFDVATGLAYLHDLDPQVIHRDLTAKNVLISENFRGKIADLGVAKIINFDISKLSDYTMTEIPGNAHYMPPEAFMKNPKYTEKLDMFSFGNLILNTVNHQWPIPSGAIFNETGHERISEIERRETHLLKMGGNHPLRKLTIRCLDNNPDDRPAALESAHVIETLINTNPPPVTNLFEMMQEVVSASKSIIKSQEKIASIEKEKEDLQRSLKETSERLQARDEQNKALEQELQATKELVNHGQGSPAPQATNDEMEEVRQKLKSAKDRRIQALNLEISGIERSNSHKVNLLDPTMELHWEQLPDIPEGRKHPQVVELNGKVYVGSGYASTEDSSHMVYAYNLETCEWETLPKSETRFFAMTVFEGKLLLLGGKIQDGTLTPKVYSFKESETEARKWIPDCMPQMLDPPRCAACAVSVMSHIVLAGGYDSTYFRTNLVDVYESYNRQWFRSKPLLGKAAEIKTAVLNGDTWYLLGGANQFKEVYCTSLRSLIFQATNSVVMSIESAMHKGTGHQDETDEDKDEDTSDEDSDSETDKMMSSPVWTKLPNVRYDSSSVTIFGNTLLSLGGATRKLLGERYLNTVNMYVPHMSSNPWVNIANLPTGVSRAGVLTLKSGEMIMIGGKTKGNETSSLVYKCTLRQTTPTV